MKNTKRKLDFKKNAIVELTELETSSIIGGTGFICSNCLTITHTFTVGLPPVSKKL